MANVGTGSFKAAQSVLRVIRRAKPNATGRVFKALHCAEGLLASALGVVRYGPMRKRSNKVKAKTQAKVA